MIGRLIASLFLCQYKPLIARLSLSVPPAVKITSLLLQSTDLASDSLASSSALRIR